MIYMVNIGEKEKMRKILAAACALAFVSLTTLVSLANVAHAIIGTGVPAPDFTLNDIQGNSYTLRWQTGKVVMLEFFFTTCGYSQIAIPDLKAVRAAFGSELVMWSLDSWDTVAALQNWETTYKPTWPDLVDNAGVNTAYGIIATPSFIIIDTVGVVRFTHVGNPGNATLISEIRSLMPVALFLVVRGTDNGIYYRFYNESTSTWGVWKKLPGATCDSPAAAIVRNKLHVVVRGTDGSSLWWGTIDLATGTFSGWTKLSGSTLSTPELASSSTTPP